MLKINIVLDHNLIVLLLAPENQIFVVNYQLVVHIRLPQDSFVKFVQYWLAVITAIRKLLLHVVWVHTREQFHIKLKIITFLRILYGDWVNLAQLNALLTKRPRTFRIAKLIDWWIYICLDEMCIRQDTHFIVVLTLNEKVQHLFIPRSSPFSLNKRHLI